MPNPLTPEAVRQAIVESEQKDQERQQEQRLTFEALFSEWMAWSKLEILEHYLTGDGEGTNWTDSRELVMLAGIKADLIRFGIGGHGGES